MQTTTVLATIVLALAVASVAWASSTAVGSASAAIPGLRVADVSNALEGQDFICGGVVRKQGLATRTCTSTGQSGRFVVTIAGPTPVQVALIRAEATLRSATVEPVVTSFLGYMATIPYDGANPSKARAWTTSHLAKGGKTRIGRVTFTVSRSGAKRTLEMKA